MIINYCDLCGTPLKENNYFMLYIHEPKYNNNFNEMEQYYNYMKQVEKSVKEVCPACKLIFDKMFELRLHRLSELAEEILNTYDLPSKKNPKERKDEKKEK